MGLPDPAAGADGAVPRGGFSVRRTVGFAALVLAVLLTLRLFSAVDVSPVPAAFHERLSLEAATARSGERGKPVLIFFTADWCGPCQAFKRGALSDPVVAGLIAERTVPAYVDIDRSPDDARALGVRSIPTLVLLDGDRQTARLQRVAEAREVVAWLNESTRP